MDCYSNGIRQECYTHKGHEKFFINDPRGQIITEANSSETEIDYLFLHHNSVSTPLIGVNLDGISQNLTLSDPYGKHLLNENINQAEFSHDFGGKRLDQETKLHNFDLRTYNNTLGLFLQIDPLYHKYIYQSAYSFANNDSINHQDPTGASAVFSPPGFSTPQPQAVGIPERILWKMLKHVIKPRRVYRKPVARKAPFRKKIVPNQPPRKLKPELLKVGQSFTYKAPNGIELGGKVTSITNRNANVILNPHFHPNQAILSDHKKTLKEHILDASISFLQEAKFSSKDVDFINAIYNIRDDTLIAYRALTGERNSYGFIDTLILWRRKDGDTLGDVYERKIQFSDDDQISYFWEYVTTKKMK